MQLRMLCAFLFIVVISMCCAQSALSVPVRADLQGEMDGVPYRIIVPEVWNGTLLVYAHGYGPYETVTPPWLAPQINTPADQKAEVNTLLSKGFALAASRFARSGYQVKEGMQNTIALTSAFREMVGQPTRTILWGKSMGAAITFAIMEKLANHYDGAVALCGPGAGATLRWDTSLDVALAYKQVFGWKDEWGTAADLNDGLNPYGVLNEVLTKVTPANKPQWDFIRMVNKLSSPGFYGPANMRVNVVLFAIAFRAELEERAGGPVASNYGRSYSLTQAEIDYLKGEGLDAEALLTQMNAEPKVTVPRNAQNYLRHYYDPTGMITKPILTLHTVNDQLAIPNHEYVYRELVQAQGKGDLLLQAYTTGAGHCVFTPQQEIAAIDAMMYWLDTGSRPDPNVFFAAIPGFDLTYEPPQWPW